MRASLIAAPPRPAVLVSVRSLEEALVAYDAGVDFIDLKEPRAGALGKLDPVTLRAVVSALRARDCSALRLSATIGDQSDRSDDAQVRKDAHLSAAVQRVASCGVDFVKVGLDARRADAPARLSRLRAIQAQRRADVIPVFIVDAGLDDARFDALFGQALASGFPALMVDTQDKQAGSVIRCCGHAALVALLERAHAAGVACGLAGALQWEDLDQVRRLRPAFAGFRSAVCDGARTNALSPQRLQALLEALRHPGPSTPTAARAPLDRLHEVAR